jgi:hypothetical protein
MTEPAIPVAEPKPNRISLDSRAVIVAVLAAILVRIGIITRVPW